MQKRATTLWEFCLVIAFLAILVAAVIPSLTDADISAQVSQARTDMRAIGSALEAYRHDYPRYPLDYVFDLSKGSSSSPTSGKKYLACLTTPVPYLPTLPGDVFFSTKTIGASFDYRYYGPDWIGLQVLGGGYPDRSKDSWALVSFGPDRWHNYGQYAFFGEKALHDIPHLPPYNGCLYDPTNGAVSAGDIVLLHEGVAPRLSACDWQKYR